MMGSKKAQMTTFIILGVVIVLFSSLGFFLYKQVTVSGFEKKADTVAEQMKITSLDTYVESCLREALLESIDSVGLRGGFLGEMPYKFMSRGMTIHVAIPPFEEYNSANYPPPPDYPNRVITKEDGTKETASFHIQPIRPYPFGGLSFPKLCQIGGPNDVPLQEFARPCPRGSYGTVSIQQSLTLRVAQGLAACVNMSYIKEITGYDVDAGSPIVSVIFGDEDVRANAEFPMKITLDEETAVRTFDFTTNAPVRIKRVYGLAQHIINNDRFYLTYDKRDMASAEWQSEFWDRAMIVNVECPNCPEDYTNVVTITDTRSDLDGKYLLFRFAVSNRIPVLEPIRGPAATDEFDFVLMDGATLRIKPLALDPDEDEIRIFFRGWRQEYITIDNTRISLPTDWYSLPGGRSIQQIPADPCTFNPDGGELPSACDVDIIIDDVIIDRRISHPHHGDHILTIIACDPLGDPDDLTNPDNHCDWQDIRIRVTGTAAVNALPGCYYDDPDACRFTSLEDPVVLETTGSSGTFSWTSPTGEVFTRLSPRATIPNDAIEDHISDITTRFPELKQNTPELTLDNIRRNTPTWIQWFLKQYVFTGTGMNTWTLDAGGMNKMVTMDVSECIPYSNPSNPSYPYNLPGDPFTADHTCCDTDGTLKSRGIPCYTGDTFGPPPIRGRDLGADPSILVEMHDDAANDIFQKTVQHLCSGTRGNICDGDVSETRGADAIAACRDFADGWQVERCEGPSITTQLGTNILTYACKQYGPGESFEKEFRLDKRGAPIGANGICADAQDYSASGGAGMFDPTTNAGPFRCGGQCNAGQCNFAANCVCDSTSRSGAGDPRCNGIPYSALAASGGRGAANALGTAWCSIECRVISPDESEAACQAAITAADGTWESRSYSSMRPANQRCCGDSPTEFLPSSGSNACCSVPNSCVIGNACIAPGDATSDGRYYCDGGTSKLCSTTYVSGRDEIVGECGTSGDGTKYCAGLAGWIDALGGPIIGRVCGGETSQCGTCSTHPETRKVQCLADNRKCSSGKTCNADLQCV